MTRRIERRRKHDNQVRAHSSLGNGTPIEFKQQQYQRRPRCAVFEKCCASMNACRLVLHNLTLTTSSSAASKKRYERMASMRCSSGLLSYVSADMQVDGSRIATSTRRLKKMVKGDY